jgi:hypothetical protein
MTATTPEVFVWTEPVPPTAIVRVRAADGTVYHRYDDWLEPSARLYAPWADGTGYERWVADEQPDEDGRLHGWRWTRLLEHAQTLTDITEPGDTARQWRTDGLPVPKVSYTNVVTGFESLLWKLAGLRTATFTVSDVHQQFPDRSAGWVSNRLDRLHAGIDRLTGIVVCRISGGNGSGVYEIRHWAAADQPPA